MQQKTIESVSSGFAPVLVLKRQLVIHRAVRRTEPPVSPAAVSAPAGIAAPVVPRVAKVEPCDKGHGGSRGETIHAEQNVANVFRHAAVPAKEVAPARLNVAPTGRPNKREPGHIGAPVNTFQQDSGRNSWNFRVLMEKWETRYPRIVKYAGKFALFLVILGVLLPPETGAFGILNIFGEGILRLVGFAAFLPVPYLLSVVAGRPLTARQFAWLCVPWLAACQRLRDTLPPPMLLGPPLLPTTVLIGRADLLVLALILLAWMVFTKNRRSIEQGRVKLNG
jgi:hypothetical protein